MMQQQNHEVELDKGFSIGLTWFIQSPIGFDTKYASHRGELPPFHSMIILLPELKAGVLIAVNTNRAAPAPFDMAHEIVSMLYKHYTGKQAKPFTLPSQSKETPTLSDQFEGFYPNVFMGPLQVKMKGKRVTIKSPMIPVPMRLYPLIDETYSVKVKLMGIPLPISLLKSVQVDFREIDMKQYIIWRFENSMQNPELRVEPLEIPAEYKDYAGIYRVLNMEKSERVVDRVELVMGKKGGFYTFKYRFLGRYDFNLAIQPTDAHTATLAGEGYFVGEKMRWETKNGKVFLYWSGLVLEKE